MDLIKFFRDKAEPFSEYLESESRLRFTFTVDGESVDGRIDGNTVTFQKKDDAFKDLVFKTDMATFKALASGEREAFTAAAKGDVRDGAPLEWEMKRPLDKGTLDTLYLFLMHFFQTGPVRAVRMDPAHARMVHGAAAIPLFYKTGMRSAYYVITKDNQLNEVGDTNPFDQAFIVIRGSGKAKLGGETVTLHDHVAYHVPKDSDHVVWTESDTPLEIIWLAWGEGA